MNGLASEVLLLLESLGPGGLLADRDSEKAGYFG
jgi:hypothetical protein